MLLEGVAVVGAVGIRGVRDGGFWGKRVGACAQRTCWDEGETRGFVGVGSVEEENGPRTERAGLVVGGAFRVLGGFAACEEGWVLQRRQRGLTETETVESSALAGRRWGCVGDFEAFGGECGPFGNGGTRFSIAYGGMGVFGGLWGHGERACGQRPGGGVPARESHAGFPGAQGASSLGQCRLSNPLLRGGWWRMGFGVCGRCRHDAGSPEGGTSPQPHPHPPCGLLPPGGPSLPAKP